MTNKTNKTTDDKNTFIINGLYEAINNIVKGDDYVATMISTEMKSMVGQKRLVKVAMLLKQDAMKAGTTATKYKQWAILKTQISQASDTHSLQGAGDKQDVEIAPKRQAQGGKAKEVKAQQAPSTKVVEEKQPATSVTYKQVETFVVDHMNETQLNDLIQAWHLKNDELAKAS